MPISTAADRAITWPRFFGDGHSARSEEHTSELQSQSNLVCRLLLEKKKHNTIHELQDTTPSQRLSSPLHTCDDPVDMAHSHLTALAVAIELCPTPSTSAPTVHETMD